MTQRATQGEAKLELMVLHEYKLPKCFPNTSPTIRLRRLLIRTLHLTETLVGLHECETIPPDQNCVHVPQVSWDSTSATKSRRHRYRTLSIQHMFKGRPKLCWLDASRETCDTSRCGQQSNGKEQRERRGSSAQS